MKDTRLLMSAVCLLATVVHGRAAIPELNAGVLLSTGSGAIQVPGYSVPSLGDWNGNGLDDLLVGEGSGSRTGKVRVYLNTGTAEAPAYEGFSYAQANGADIEVAGAGCLGIFPRLVDWSGDGSMDLLVGLANGQIGVFLNQNTAPSLPPALGPLQLLRAGDEGSLINVGFRATPSMVDWNGDGRGDLVAGCLGGTVQVFLNGADSGMPDLAAAAYAQTTVGTLTVPSSRSSPMVWDLDGDGVNDILTGNTNGELLAYLNVGTNEAPVFSSSPIYLEAAGQKIQLGSRSRPFVGDYNNNGVYDILVGTATGTVHLFAGIPTEIDPLPGDANGDGIVDLDDFVILKQNFGTTSAATWSMGDFNGDGAVDLDDFVILKQNFGTAAIPEPAALLLLTVGFAGLRRRR